MTVGTTDTIVVPIGARERGDALEVVEGVVNRARHAGDVGAGQRAEAGDVGAGAGR